MLNTKFLPFSFTLIALTLLSLSFLSYTPSSYAQESTHQQTAKTPKIAYLVSDIEIPFWKILANGIQSRANHLGYKVEVLSANNSKKTELENVLYLSNQDAENYAGVILSPTSSSAAATVLKFTQQQKLPVVVADIGSDNRSYVSYIASDNYNGANALGKSLAQSLNARGVTRGSVGIIAIPQSRQNGRERTSGFMSALETTAFKGAGIKQQANFSYQETYDFTAEFIRNHSDLVAIWLQGSDRYQAALDAIRDAKKSNSIALLTFDSEPEFLELIPAGIISAAAMQQPFLMGIRAMNTLHDHLQGNSVSKMVKLPVLVVNTQNIDSLRPIITRNVLGQSTP